MIAQNRTLIWSTLAVTILLIAPPAQAQFISGSTGADGALNITTPGTYDFFPTNTALFPSPVDTDGDNVYHFTTITIGSGVTLRLRGSRLRMRPVYWLATGTVQIDGTIDLSGQNGYLGTDPNAALRAPSEPGPGGYPGGVGNTPTSPAEPGSGPGGGQVSTGGDGRGGGAGYATTGECVVGNCGGASYGNVFLVPLLGGSGGAGARAGISGAAGSYGSGGGAGGGALLIASAGVIRVNGTINTNGGIGGGNTGNGSGGTIHLKASTVSGAGVLTAVGIRVAGTGISSDGRIRREAFTHSFTGTSSPTPSIAAPSPVALPLNLPSVRVVAVGGVAVPENPTGGFEAVDVAINAGTAATVEIAARNIPLGTVVKLHVFSVNGGNQIIDSTPLAGTVAQSTATVAIVFPNGFSRAFPRAVWTPQ
jgi:hypothetical protein